MDRQTRVHRHTPAAGLALCQAREQQEELGEFVVKPACGNPFGRPFIHSFIQPVFSEHPLCVRPHARHIGYRMNHTDPSPQEAPGLALGPLHNVASVNIFGVQP